MTKRRIISLILALVMVMLSVAPLASCGDNDICTTHSDTDNNGLCDKCGETVPKTEKCTSHVDKNADGICDTAGCGAAVEPSQKSNYVIRVQTLGGYYPAELEIDLYDSVTGNQVLASRTDENGYATFKNLPVKSTYVAKFAEIYEGKTTKINTFLKGYDYEEEYKIDVSGTVITLIPKLQAPGHSGVSYQLGDQMHDFSFVDSDGKTRTLSEILKTKDAVILNFWYIGCGPCQAEFPSMQAAYDAVIDENGTKYSDKVEILALNIKGDAVRDIQQFKDDLGLAFPMGADTDVYRAFGFEVVPSTVIVDRYGMVTAMHSGGIDRASYWKKLFSIYTSEDYVQRTVESFDDLIPQDIPDVEQPSSDVIKDYFVSKEDEDIKVSFHPETRPGDADYAWPFITTEYTDKKGNKINCIIPANSGKDNSYAIIYATMELEAGEAVMFDFHSSTESTGTTADILFIIVDGKDTYMISGLEKEDVWMSCCAFVAEKAGVYEVAFVYQKDAADDDLPGVEDVVYLRNLRTVDKSMVDVETYIAREAATLSLSDLFLGADGYYHVGSENGPILLANFLGFTLFDDKMSVSQRLYSNGTFMVNNKEMFHHMVLYGNYAANSAHYGYTSVTKELKELLDEYCKQNAADIGVKYSESSWLSLCEYFDAYGTDGKELEDPIKGLATFSANDLVLSEDKDNPVFNKVSYNNVIMPRGYLYKFVPEKSGVYRFLTQSEFEVDGWIFTGSHSDWAENGAQRIFFKDSEQGERYPYYFADKIGADGNPGSDGILECYPYLLVDSNGDGVLERDLTNATILSYLEAGKEYYVAFGFYDVYQFESFTFTAYYEGESYKAFFEASPGVFTFTEDTYEMIVGGIDVALYNGYYYHKITKSRTVEEFTTTLGNGTTVDYEKDGDWVTKKITTTILNGKMTVVTEEYARGSVLYADFIWTTNIFTSRTMKQLIEAHAFNQMFTADDLEALAVYTISAKQGYKEYYRIKAWLEANYDAQKHGTLEDYVYSMTSDREILEILFEKKWIDEDREGALRQEGYSLEGDIIGAKGTEWYSFYVENDTADYKSGIKPGYSLVYDYLKKNGKVKVTLDEFIKEKIAYEEYQKEMTADSEGLELIFDNKWIADGREAALKSEGKTASEIGEIKAALRKSYVDAILAKQAEFNEFFSEKWESEGLADIEAGLYNKTYYEGSHVDMYHVFGKRGFYDYYGTDCMLMWGRYTVTSVNTEGESVDKDGNPILADIGFRVEEILVGKFHGTIHSDLDTEAINLFVKAAQEALEAEWGDEYTTKYKEYGIENIDKAFKNGTLNDESLNPATVSLYINAGKAQLKATFGEEYDEKWAYYKFDDILEGKFHNDFTEEMRKIYEENIIFENGNLVYDESAPELQGCVKVDERLAELLQMLMDKYSFAGVKNSWTKLCYYYEYLG